MRPLPWRALWVWSLIAVAVLALFLTAAVRANGGHPVDLIAGRDGPAAPLITHDFPRVELPAGLGHDGQQFYAIARQPMHPRDVQPSLGGNPRYRYQRIVYPVLAWALHPSGGGNGLVWSMLAVGLLAALGGALATGALSVTLGGPAWASLVFAFIPGVIATVRLSTADNLALALTATAIVLLLRGHPLGAVLVAVAAGLSREVSLISLVGFALWRRDRWSIAFVVAPAAAVLGWFAALRAIFPHVPYRSDRSTDLSGLRVAFPYWWHHDRGALVIALVTAAAVVATIALTRRSPLFATVMLNAIVVFFLADEALDAGDNLARTLLPALFFAVVALLVRLQQSGRAPIVLTRLDRQFGAAYAHDDTAPAPPAGAGRSSA